MTPVAMIRCPWPQQTQAQVEWDDRKSRRPAARRAKPAGAYFGDLRLDMRRVRRPAAPRAKPAGAYFGDLRLDMRRVRRPAAAVPNPPAPRFLATKTRFRHLND